MVYYGIGILWYTGIERMVFNGLQMFLKAPAMEKLGHQNVEMVKRNSHWIPSAINRTQKHSTASIHNPARCLLSKMCLMLEMIERTPSSSILFSHMPTFSLKKLLRNHCSVAFARKTSMSSSSGAMSVGNSGYFFFVSVHQRTRWMWSLPQRLCTWVM